MDPIVSPEVETLPAVAVGTVKGMNPTGPLVESVTPEMSPVTLSRVAEEELRNRQDLRAE